jgi:hypothetical protein
MFFRIHSKVVLWVAAIAMGFVEGTIATVEDVDFREVKLWIP